MIKINSLNRLLIGALLAIVYFLTCGRQSPRLSQHDARVMADEEFSSFCKKHRIAESEFTERSLDYSPQDNNYGWVFAYKSKRRPHTIIYVSVDEDNHVHVNFENLDWVQ